MNQKTNPNSVEVSTDGCGGCGCLLLGAGGTYLLCKATMWTAGRVHDIIQEVPGGYITVIGSSIILKTILNARNKKRKKWDSNLENADFGNGKIIDVQVEVLEPRQ